MMEGQVKDVKWLAGWHAERLHAVLASDMPRLDVSVRALCGAYVYPKPRSPLAERKLARGLPMCKHCARLLAPKQTKPVATCEWKREGYYWTTACGCDFQLLDGTPVSYGFKFCPSCGKPVRI